MSGAFAQTPAEELLLVAEEIAGLKSIVRDVSGQLNRMERRVKTALGTGNGKKANGARRPSVRALSSSAGKKPAPPAAAMTEEDARRAFDKMVAQVREDGRNELVERQLRAMTVKGDLTAIARALGLTYAKFPKPKLIRMILMKIQEDVLLSERFRRPDAAAAPMAAAPPHHF